MKRAQLFILSLLMILPLAACGNTESEYRYDNIPELVIDSYTTIYTSSRPIKGGSLYVIEPYIYFGMDVKETETGKNPLCVLFDEERKTLTPLCFDYTCEHNSSECFAFALSWARGGGYWNVFEDNIVVVTNGFSHHIVGDVSPYDANAWFFSLDGTMQKKISFDLRTLVRQDGSFAVKPIRDDTCIAVGDKVYFDVSDWSDQADVNAPQNHWVVCYDLEREEFYSVANYVLPDSFCSYVEYTEFTESELGISYDKRYSYLINLEDGTYKETDCAEIYSRLVSSGVAETGYADLSLFPISKVIQSTTDGLNVFYYDMESEQRLDPDENPLLKILAPWEHYYYDGETMYKVGERDEKKLAYFTADGKDRLTVSRYFENDAYYIHRCEAESENGLIFNFFNSGESWYDEQYTVNEHGKEVVYQKPPRLIYVTKDDYFDGQIDEPWYYDAETGMFVQ